MSTNIDIELLNRNNFRNCLEALARPGDVFPIKPFADSSLMAMAAMLLYSEVSFYQQAEEDWNMIQALTNSKEVAAKEADYLFLNSPLEKHLLEAKAGDQQNPEFSATLICCCDLASGTGVRLSGPGIDGTKETSLPVTTSFLRLLAQKNNHFPLGVDMYFISGNNTLCGLPRTTMVEIL
ncbi:MAG TPA: phosphonate C-P lyase system protein PhnH [Desulfobacterales bacterium]|nr:phosphonate C-P lyase system protein PhnH [Desulfobacterales bacterium]